jgi:hypothetical protein
MTDSLIGTASLLVSLPILLLPSKTLLYASVTRMSVISLSSSSSYDADMPSHIVDHWHAKPTRLLAAHLVTRNVLPVLLVTAFTLSKGWYDRLGIDISPSNRFPAVNTTSTIVETRAPASASVIPAS